MEEKQLMKLGFVNSLGLLALFLSYTISAVVRGEVIYSLFFSIAVATAFKDTRLFYIAMKKEKENVRKD